MSEIALTDEWDLNVLEGDLSGYRDLGTFTFPDATQPHAATSPVQENAAGQNLRDPDRASFSQPPNGDRRRLDEEAAASQEIQPDLPKLRRLQWNEWDEHGAYNEDPPTCIRYALEVNVTAKKQKKRNKSVILRETEPLVVLAPSVYWDRVLYKKVKKQIKRKYPSGPAPQPEDCTVIVSVTDRGEQDLVKQFESLNIRWLAIENQLQAWSESLRNGKKLRVKILCNFVDYSSAQATSHTGTVGRQSATARQLTQLDPETSSQKVLRLFSCDDGNCGPYCFNDPDTKKHRKLLTLPLKHLVRYKENGFALNSHSDVPEHIRQEIRASEQERQERHEKLSSRKDTQPIHINNIMPSQSEHSLATTVERLGSAHVAELPACKRLRIPGPRDVAVWDYVRWQQANVQEQSSKQRYQDAGQLLVDQGWDPAQLYNSQRVKMLVDAGMVPGIAQHFIDDIKEWAEGYTYEDMKAEFI